MFIWILRVLAGVIAAVLCAMAFTAKDAASQQSLYVTAVVFGGLFGLTFVTSGFQAGKGR